MTRYFMTSRLPLLAALAATAAMLAASGAVGEDFTRRRGPDLDFQGNRLRQNEYNSATAVETTQPARQTAPQVARAETAVGAPNINLVAPNVNTVAPRLQTRAPNGLAIQPRRSTAGASSATPLTVTGPLHFAQQKAAATSTEPTKLVVPVGGQAAARIVADLEPEVNAVPRHQSQGIATPAQHASNGNEPANLAYEEQAADEIAEPTAGPEFGERPAGPSLGELPSANIASEDAAPIESSSDSFAQHSAYDHSAYEDDYGYPTRPLNPSLQEESQYSERQSGEFAVPGALYTSARRADALPASGLIQRDSIETTPAAPSTVSAPPRNFVASGATFAGRGYRGASNYYASRQEALFDGAVYSQGQVAVNAAPGTMPTSPMFGGQYAFSPRQMLGNAIGEPAATAWPPAAATNSFAANTYLASNATGGVQYDLTPPTQNSVGGTCDTCGDGSTPCFDCGQCNECCSCRQGYWEAGAQAIVLRRSAASSDGSLISCNCLLQHELTFNASDADLQWGSGYRFNLRRVNHCGPDFEIIYFNNADWLYDNWFTGNLIVLGTNVNNGSAHARYRSSLQSAEANVAVPWNNWTNVLLGFRWFELEEQASISARGTNTSFATSIDTLNDLIGGQIGIERAILDQGDCLTIYATGKTGVYANRITRTSSGFSAPIATENEISFSAELDLRAKYQFNPRIALTAGYNLLWLETTALAIEQYSDPTGAIDTAGSPFYHGFLLGLELNW